MGLVLDYRVVVSLGLSAIIGAIGLRLWPFPVENLFLALIDVQCPGLHLAMAYAYATRW
jgi:hypothetical protein